MDTPRVFSSMPRMDLLRLAALTALTTIGIPASEPTVSVLDSILLRNDAPSFLK